MINKRRPLLPLGCAIALSASSAAHANTWDLGAVLDLTAQSQTTPLGLRDQGLQLGHSDVFVRGNLGSHLRMEGVGIVATHEGRLEKRVERLFFQTRSLPGGLQFRGGRFASQIGYLNEQHPHADDFVERPLLYRAFLGHHYSDNGLRLNWVAPTHILVQVGMEGFSGRRLTPDAVQAPAVGVQTLNLKLGGDWGSTQAWQLGLSWVKNRRTASAEALGHLHEDPADEAGEEHDANAHGARFSGRRMVLMDATWKWAPAGNPRAQQLRVSVEHAQVSRMAEPGLEGRQQDASALSLVWKFRPDWETGWRADRLRALVVHEGSAEATRLQEQSIMVAFKPSHRQSLRLQWTAHRKAEGLESLGMLPRRTVSLQYLVAFGAHGAHAF